MASCEENSNAGKSRQANIPLTVFKVKSIHKQYKNNDW